MGRLRKYATASERQLAYMARKQAREQSQQEMMGMVKPEVVLIKDWAWYERMLGECQRLHEAEMREWLTANWKRADGTTMNQLPKAAEVTAEVRQGVPYPKPVAAKKRFGR
jgi:predicted alpha/beta hydrolase